MASTNDSDDAAPEALPEGVTQRWQHGREPGTWGGHVSRRKAEASKVLDMPIVRRFEAAWAKFEMFAATLDWKTPPDYTRHFAKQNYGLRVSMREKLLDHSYAQCAETGQVLGLLKAMDKVIGANTVKYDDASRMKDIHPLDIPALRAQIMAIHDTIRPPEAEIPAILRR